MSKRRDPYSWELDTFNASVVLDPHPILDDPEESLLVSLTRREFGLILWAVQALSRICPETSSLGLSFYAKLTELGREQGFLEISEERMTELNDILRDENDEPLLGGS